MADTSLKTQLVIETKAEGNEELARVQDALRELSAAADSGDEQFAKLTKEMQVLAQQVQALEKLKSIAQQSAVIEQVRRLSEGVVETAVNLDMLREKSDAAGKTLGELKQNLEGAAKGSDEFQRLESKVQGAQKTFDDLAASVDKTEQELRQQRAELQDATREMQAAGAASGDWEQAQRDLNVELQNVTKTIRELDKAAQVEADRGLLGVGAHKDVQKEIDATRAALERLKASGQLTWKEQAQAALKADERIRELKNSINGWAESLGKAKVALVGLGGSVAGIKKMVDSAIDFESAMADVAKVVDGTEEQMAGLAGRIKEMSGEIPIAAKGLAQMAAAGGQMGVPIEKLETFVQLAAKMGTAFGMSAEQAGDAVAKLSNVFGLPIEQVEKLGDAINVLGNTMAAKESDIVEVLKRIGGSAKQFGLSAEQAAALGASMLSLGVRAEVAGTGINAILTKLQTASMQGKEFQAALQSMGVSAEQLARDIEANPQKALEQFLKTISKLEGSARAETLTKLFGIEYQDDVARLIGSLETYEGALGRIGDKGKVAGAMQKEFQERVKTTGAQLETLSNSLNVIAINLGEAFLPLVNKLAGELKDAAQGIASFAASFPVLAGLAQVLAGTITAAAGLKTAVLAARVAGIGAFTEIAATVKALNIEIGALAAQTSVTAAAMKTAGGVAMAAWTGWNIGKELREQFLEVEQTGIALAAGLTKTFERIKGAWEIVKAAFNDDTMSDAYERLQKRLVEIDDEYQVLFEEAQRAHSVIKEGADEAAKPVEQLAGEAAKAADEQKKLAGETEKSAAAQKEMADKTGETAKAMEQVGAGAEKARQQMSAAEKDMLTGLDTLRKKLLDVGTGADEMQKAMAAAFAHAIPTMETIEGVNALRQAMKEAAEAGDLSQQAFHMLDQQLAAHSATIVQAAADTGEMTVKMGELTEATGGAAAKLDEYANALVYLGSVGGDTAAAAREAVDALSQLGSGASGGLERAAANARAYADAAREAGEASSEAAEASKSAGHVSYGTWWDAKIAASDYAEAASRAALEATGFAQKGVLGAQAIANMNLQLRNAAHSYIDTMEGFDRQMQQIAGAQSGAARGVEDLQMRLLQLNGSEEQIAEARAARERAQLEREIKMLEIERSRAAFLGDKATVEMLDEELRLMGEQQQLLAQIHKEEARQRQEAAREKERQEKEARRKESEAKKKAGEAASASKSTGGGGNSSGGSDTQTKNNTINLGGITINGAGVSDPAKLAKMLEPELKKLQRLAA